MTDRRQFLQFLAGSPLLATAGLSSRLLQDLTSASPRRAADAFSLAQQTVQGSSAIRSASEALDVFDFEPVAKAKIPVAHWAYLATGTDDDGTIRPIARIRTVGTPPRRLVDVQAIDGSVTLFGSRYPTPIVINPVGARRRSTHWARLLPRARPRRGTTASALTVATTSIEDAIAERGATVWFQLYHQRDWAKTKQMVQRRARGKRGGGFHGGPDWREQSRDDASGSAPRHARNCIDCHPGAPPVPGIRGASLGDTRRKPNLTGYPAVTPPPKSARRREFIDRLKAATSMKVLIKGSSL
jgi:(S)-2-hydroxy-acid oxidase